MSEMLGPGFLSQDSDGYKPLSVGAIYAVSLGDRMQDNLDNTYI